MIKVLLHEFTVSFPDVLGKTTIGVHDVDVLPIKQHSYRINYVD